MRTESSFIGAHGTTIVYDRWVPEQPAVATLVLSHGVGEHARRYDHVVTQLTGLGFVVFALDHRGHGRSGGKRVHLDNWTDFTDDMATLFGIVSAEYPTHQKFLLGHSMGGAIALSYAIEHQADLAGLLLSGPGVLVHRGVPKPVLIAGKFLGKFFPDLPIRTLDVSAISRDPAVVAAYKNDERVWQGKIPAGIARGMVQASESFPHYLSTLTLPILLQHGAADRLTAAAGSELVANSVASTDVTLKIYPGLFHEIFNEPEQDEVLTDLSGWLRQRI